MIPFKNAFNQLLSPKQLLAPDVRQQKWYYELEGQRLELTTLSSGETEIVNLVFDLLLREPSHSIIIFDEPELHLHPELLIRLTQTLSSIGNNNQFIFSTHSADLISSSLNHSVVLLTSEGNRPDNQAIYIREDGSNRDALLMLGQSMGIIALGKKVVLIEGENESLDKQVYGSIIRERFPEFVLLPIGGKGIIEPFPSLVDSVLDRTIWGIEFFMIRDRDAMPPVPSQILQERSGKKERLRALSRYHLENYFLDEHVIASVFSTMDKEGSWLTDPKTVGKELRQIARTMVSYASALIVSDTVRREVGNLDIMPKACHEKTCNELVNLVCDRLSEERVRINTRTDPGKIQDLLRETFKKLEDSLQDPSGSWKSYIPGKQLFNKFAKAAKFDAERLKSLYLKEAEKHSPNPFTDIIAIFEDFRRLSEIRQ